MPERPSSRRVVTRARSVRCWRPCVTRRCSRKIRRAGLQRHVWQWQSFAAFCQYRRVHEATVGYLRPGPGAFDRGCGNGRFSPLPSRATASGSVGYSARGSACLSWGRRRALPEHHGRGDPARAGEASLRRRCLRPLVFSIGVLRVFTSTRRAATRARLPGSWKLERVTLKPGRSFSLLPPAPIDTRGARIYGRC